VADVATRHHVIIPQLVADVATRHQVVIPQLVVVITQPHIYMVNKQMPMAFFLPLQIHKFQL
jgi:hypothetical protein